MTKKERSKKDKPYHELFNDIFNFQDVKEDVKFILKTYFPENKFPDKQIGSRKY